MFELLFLAFFEGVFTMGPDSWTGYPLLFKGCLVSLWILVSVKGLTE